VKFLQELTPAQRIVSVLVVIVAALSFQFFFRYTYIHTIGANVTRIDRLTGASCDLPCEQVAQMPPAPIVSSTPEAQSDVDARAVDYERRTHSQDMTTPSYAWKVHGHYTNAGAIESAGDAVVSNSPETDYPVRVMCYCDKNNGGWYFELRRSAYGAFSEMMATGNSVLEARYGLTASK